MSEEDEDVIEEMMEKIEDNTCLRFRWTIVMIIFHMMVMIIMTILAYASGGPL